MEEKGSKVEPLYGEMKIMKEFNLTPFQWDELHRWDKLALQYQSIMESYYELKSIDDQKADMERKKHIKKNLPKQQPPRRRGKK